MVNMRAVDIKNGSGPATSLYISDQVPVPEIKPSECLIKVKFFGLNRADLLQREGKYPVPPGVTRILGLEFSGVIEEVGQDDKGDWKKGDEVFGLAYGGAYAEFIAVNKRMLIHRDPRLSWEICGGLCEAWFTALKALYIAGEYESKPTKAVLFHAGASAVSIAGIQLALNGMDPPPKVFVTARQDSKIDFCVKTLGATAGVNTTTIENGDWASAIRKLNDGEGIDLTVDYIGAPYFQGCLDVAAQDGRIVQLGVMGGVDLQDQGHGGKGVNIAAFVAKRVKFQGSTLRSRSPEFQGDLRDLFVEKVMPNLLGEGKVKFENHIDRVFNWMEIVKAHEYMESNKSQGKIICRVE